MEKDRDRDDLAPVDEALRRQKERDEEPLLGDTAEDRNLSGSSTFETLPDHGGLGGEKKRERDD